MRQDVYEMDNEKKLPQAKPSLRERLQQRVGKAGKSPWKALMDYFIDVRAEVKKVIWPTRKQLINNTGIVLIAIAIIGLFIWGLDIGLTFGVRGISSLFNTGNPDGQVYQLPEGTDLSDFEEVYNQETDGALDETSPDASEVPADGETTDAESDTTDAQTDAE